MPNNENIVVKELKNGTHKTFESIRCSIISIRLQNPPVC